MIEAVRLAPIPALAPLVAAALLLALSHKLPPLIDNAIAIGVSAGVAALAALLAVYVGEHGPATYWFGGWTPRRDVTLGISFWIDPIGACVAAFVGFLFTAAIAFAWSYFDRTRAHFHVLMMLFLAAMAGFVLTRDLFDLFVWFEVMSVAAYALTAYRLETPSLAGALNFTVTNSLASFLMLASVGLIYARLGVLDFQALGDRVQKIGDDPVLTGAFCALAVALMIKAAIAPFHFWLSDAHAVAPSPVSVIFSGVMAPLGVFALAKLYYQVFSAVPDIAFLFHHVFQAFGAVAAIVGGLMAWSQRHLKRMLAFSTIAHIGVMMIGITSFSPSGLTGFFFYLIGHGLVKGSLFMIAGMLLAMFASVDEFELKGRGASAWPMGAAMAAGGLLLAGFPVGSLDLGSRMVEEAMGASGSVLAHAATIFGSALTGAAVLRAVGRIFLNLGPDPGLEESGPLEKEREPERPFWAMMTPAICLLVLAAAPVVGLASHGEAAARIFAAGHFPPGASSAASPTLSWLSVLAAVGLALLSLSADKFPKGLVAAARFSADPPLRLLRRAHTGLVGDYVVWIFIGLSAIVASLLLA